MPRLAAVLTIAGSLLLLAMAAMHASGFAYVAREIAVSALPDFLKATLPSMWLYPSAAMAVLAVYALTLLRSSAPRGGLAFVAAAALLNSILGFVLGGLLPGLAMLASGVLFLVAVVGLRR